MEKSYTRLLHRQLSGSKIDMFRVCVIVLFCMLCFFLFSYVIYYAFLPFDSFFGPACLTKPYKSTPPPRRRVRDMTATLLLPYTSQFMRHSIHEMHYLFCLVILFQKAFFAPASTHTTQPQTQISTTAAAPRRAQEHAGIQKKDLAKRGQARTQKERGRCSPK